MKFVPKAILILVGISVIAACPLTGSAVLGWPLAYAENTRPQPVVSFEPSIPPLGLTSFAETAFAESIATASPVATPVSGPAVATVSGNTMTIGGRSYPIGDTFTDASEIPMGAIEDSRFGEYGYSTIIAVGAQDYRLLWVTEAGERKYIIVREDNNTFSGPDGFTTQVDNLQEAEELTFDAVKIELGGVAGILVAELAVCPFTAAAGCAAAVATGATALIGGAALGLWRVFGDWMPAQRDVEKAFVQIDINNP